MVPVCLPCHSPGSHF
jgi:hypothetical protein